MPYTLFFGIISFHGQHKTRGVHPSEAIMHFPPVSYFPPVFLVIDYKFSISPYFPNFCAFPPISRKLLFPLLSQISLCFRYIYLFFTYLLLFPFPILFISFPPTPHYAFIHHIMRVL